jgi:hypothetical protein
MSPVTAAVFISATVVVVGVLLEWSVRFADADEWNRDRRGDRDGTSPDEEAPPALTDTDR